LRLLANLGVIGSAPLFERFHDPSMSPHRKKSEVWMDGFYFDQPDKWDDPCRFFTWVTLETPSPLGDKLDWKIHYLSPIRRCLCISFDASSTERRETNSVGPSHPHIKSTRRKIGAEIARVVKTNEVILKESDVAHRHLNRCLLPRPVPYVKETSFAARAIEGSLALHRRFVEAAGAAGLEDCSRR